jgi:hypothetical protein
VNDLEAVVITRYVRALCPQQKFDEYTADAWIDVLAPYTLDDCKRSAALIAGRQPFVAPAEIVAEVKKLRNARLEGFQYEPVDGDDNPKVYLENYRAQRELVANGLRAPSLAIPPSGDQRLINEIIGTSAAMMPRPRA